MVRRHRPTLTGVDFLGTSKSFIQCVSIVPMGAAATAPTCERLLARTVPWGKVQTAPDFPRLPAPPAPLQHLPCSVLICLSRMKNACACLRQPRRLPKLRNGEKVRITMNHGGQALITLDHLKVGMNDA